MPLSSQSLVQLLGGEDVASIAQALLGATITTRIGGHITSGLIVETEAYKAPEDKGSHAHGNKRTGRTETMFKKPGRAYIYLCYGIHHLVNVVTGPEGTAHAVLLRAVEPKAGETVMMHRRNQKKISKSLTNGPGKLSQALGLTTMYDDYDLLSEDGQVSLVLPPTPILEEDVICSPRVGIAYAQECAHWPWRFRIKGNGWTSLPHEVNYAV